jgi:phosphoesterase RecJ-like protein
MGKEAVVYNIDSIPRVLHFLPHQNIYQQRKEIDRSFDVMVVVDCGDAGRTGLMEKGASLPSIVINIDHHVTNKHFGSINWINSEATATGEMIYDLIQGLGLPITPGIALSLYTALFTETGSFRYSNTTSKALRIAAELVEKGIKPDWLSQQIYETRSFGGLRLLGEVLTRMERSNDGRIAWVVVTQELFDRTQSDLEDSEDFVNYPRSLEGVEVAVFFREIDPTTYKISFRARDGVDVAELAEEFGGGGHRYAAGCRIRGNLDQVKKSVLEAVVRQINKG